MKFELISVGFNYYEKIDCVVKRPNGSLDYLFLFFTTETFVEIDHTLITVPSGTCIIYTPTYPQLYYNNKDGFTNDWFHFSGSKVDSFFEQLNLPLNTPFQIRNYSDIRLFIKTLEVEFIKKDLHWEHAVNSIITNNFVHIAREYQHQTNYIINPYKTDLLEKFKIARVEILTNYQKTWKISEMADLVNLSRSRFTILYKEFFQCSPMEDLIRERIEKAKYLLSTHTMSVSSVAYKVGYENICHFNRQFKKITSVPPGKYAK
jgi:AraC family transcriptional regulator of arabinose operon